jgi:hypothetical protein
MKKLIATLTLVGLLTLGLGVAGTSITGRDVGDAPAVFEVLA